MFKAYTLIATFKWSVAHVYEASAYVWNVAVSVYTFYTLTHVSSVDTHRPHFIWTLLSVYATACDWINTSCVSPLFLSSFFEEMRSLVLSVWKHKIQVQEFISQQQCERERSIKQSEMSNACYDCVKYTLLMTDRRRTLTDKSKERKGWNVTAKYKSRKIMSHWNIKKISTYTSSFAFFCVDSSR